MRLLLDTHAFLWFAGGDPRLPSQARRAMEAPDAELVLSAATVWEIAIKSGLGRLKLPEPLPEYLAQKVAEGFRLLPVEAFHAASVESLPSHHRDPFDRLLVAQAMAERMPIVTGDTALRAYPVKVIW